MSRLDRWIDNKIAQNLFVWLFLFLILTTSIQTDNKVSAAFFVILLLMPAVYINNLIILPFLKKKAIVFIGLFISNAVLFSAISVFFISLVTEIAYELKMFVNFLGILVLALIFAAALKMARDSFTRRQQVKDAELKLLKAQLNPHFLFNTLNNLYGLSVTKSDKLPDLMLKLSNLLRYSLYETKDIAVPLEKEVHYLENYIALEKIRLEDQTTIVFENKVIDVTTKIAPMLLIVFVENAFKHLNVSGNIKSHVLISLEEVDHSLVFNCINTATNSNSRQDHDLEKGRSGIGLQNVKKRLSLLYPERHELKMNATDNEYHVALTLHNLN